MKNTKKTKPIRVVIRASKWLRGNGSTMRDCNGRMCCLGFDALACGITEEYLGDWEYGSPTDILALGPPEGIPKGYEFKGENKAIDINDTRETTDEEKIALLRPIFREAGRILVWRPDL